MFVLSNRSHVARPSLATRMLNDIVSARRHLSSGSWSLGGSGRGSSLTTLSSSSGRVLVLLSWAVDGDLDGNLATLNLLAVHVGARLLLELLARERHEAETAALAWLVAGLKLADHELGDGTKGDLGGGGRVVGEDLEELSRKMSVKVCIQHRIQDAYALLTEIVWQIGDHDLRLAGNTVLWWATLLAGRAGLVITSLTSRDGGLVGGGSQWVGSSSITVGGSLALLTALASATASTSSTATTASAATGGVATAGAISVLAALSVGSSGRLGFASELNRHLAVENGLSVEVLDGALGLGRGGYVNEGVTDGASGAWVGRDGGGLAVVKWHMSVCCS